MRNAHHPNPNQTARHWRAAEFWLFWLIGVVARIGAFNGSRRLRWFVARAERWAEMLLFLAATDRIATAPKRARRPRSIPPGMRGTRSTHRLLYKSARIRVRGSLSARLAAIAAALAAPERIIARLVKRLRRGLTPTRLVLTAPIAQTLVARATAPLAADSS